VGEPPAKRGKFSPLLFGLVLPTAIDDKIRVIRHLGDRLRGSLMSGNARLIRGPSLGHFVSDLQDDAHSRVKNNIATPNSSVRLHATLPTRE
jgi:hypothetical protein